MIGKSDREAEWRKALRTDIKAKERTSIPRVKMAETDVAVRIASQQYS